MAKVRLTWTDSNTSEDGVRIFRDTSPIDPAALPAPLVDIPKGRGLYEDRAVTAGVTYHYYVASFDGAVTGPGVAAQVTAQEDLPRFLYSSEMIHNGGSTATITQTIPHVRAGDLIVAIGLRRFAVTAVTAGFANAGAPPDPFAGAGLQQWSFAYWKIATGNETGAEFSVTCSAAGRLGLTILVFRHDSKPIVCTTLALQRAPTGPASATPLQVTNGPSPALLLVAASRIYAPTAGTCFLRNWSRGFPPVFPEWDITHPRRLQMRHLALMTEAQANEAVSVSYTEDTSNDSDSRSSIWLSIGAQQ